MTVGNCLVSWRTDSQVQVLAIRTRLEQPQQQQYSEQTSSGLEPLVSRRRHAACRSTASPSVPHKYESTSFHEFHYNYSTDKSLKPVIQFLSVLQHHTAYPAVLNNIVQLFTTKWMWCVQQSEALRLTAASWLEGAQVVEEKYAEKHCYNKKKADVRTM